jgi:uncharacterized protein (DUF2141 family)
VAKSEGGVTKNSTMKKLFIFAVSLLMAITAKSQSINIVVSLSNVSSNNGSVKVYFFTDADAFPTKINQAVKVVSVKALKGTTQIPVEGLASGNYALAIHHDENNDGKINTNFIGIPKEPMGVSNGAVGKMGPPKYKDAVISLRKNGGVVNIKL